MKLTGRPGAPSAPASPSFPAGPGVPVGPRGPFVPRGPSGPFKCKYKINDLSYFCAPLHQLTLAPCGPAGPASPCGPGAPYRIDRHNNSLQLPIVGNTYSSTFSAW